MVKCTSVNVCNYFVAHVPLFIISLPHDHPHLFRSQQLAYKNLVYRRLNTHTHTHTHHSLITDDDGSYLPRPEWAKATGAGTLQLYGDTSELHIDSTLSDLEEEALYISRDSLEEFEPIGEG